MSGRRQQVLTVELRPGAEPVEVGTVISRLDDGPFDISGWVADAGEVFER